MSSETTTIVSDEASENKPDPKTPSVVRKAYLKVWRGGKGFTEIFRQVHKRAARIMEVLVSDFKGLNNEGHLYLCQNNGQATEVSGSPDSFKNDLYNLIVKGTNAGRCIRGAFSLPPGKCTTGKKSTKPLEQALRQALDTGVLPVSLGPWNLGTGYDFMSFALAISALKSWHECNSSAESNFKKATARTNALPIPTDKDLKTLNEWSLQQYPNRDAHDKRTFVTKRMIKKLKAKGWKAEGDKQRPWDWTTLKNHKDDPNHWASVIEWVLAKEGLLWLRPTARCTLPHPDASPRELPFGTNTVPFKVAKDVQTGGLAFTIDGHILLTMPSKQFKNLEIEPVGNNFRLTYSRGNNSPTEEKVVADLKEITLRLKKGKWFIGLCLNVQVPAIAPEAWAVKDYLYSTDIDEGCPVGIKILGADLGITDPVAWTVAQTVDEKGGIETLAEGIIGHKETKSTTSSVEVSKTLKDLQESIDWAFGACNYIAERLRKPSEVFDKNGNHKSEIWTLRPATWKDLDKETKATTVSQWEKALRLEKIGWYGTDQNLYDIISDVRKKMANYRGLGYRNKGNNGRNRGPSHEQLKFLFVFKRYISLLKKWSRFGCDPCKPGKTIKGFESLYKQLDDLKNDFRKKAACELVRKARQYGASVIALENLEHFLPDQANDNNELLMIWGSGQLARWVEHFASQYGILVLKVPPRNSSQVVDGEFWARSRENHRLLRSSTGPIEKNANIAASRNLIQIVATQELCMPHLLVSKVASGYAPSLKDDIDEGRVFETEEAKKTKEKETKKVARIKMRLTKKFGSHHILVQPDGKLVVLDKKLNEKPIGNPLYLNQLPDGRWVESKAKYTWQDEVLANQWNEPTWSAMNAIRDTTRRKKQNERFGG